jgi:hypothetical protein
MATSNADFYRAQFAARNNQDLQRRNDLQDTFTRSQYDTLAQSLANVQNNPSLSPEDKANQINSIRQQQLKIMTPGMAKGHLAKMMQQFGITDTSGPQSVPAQAPLTLGAQPNVWQEDWDPRYPKGTQPVSQEDIQQSGGAVSAPSPDAIKVQPEAMSGVESLTPSPVTLPAVGPQRVAQAPTSVNMALAGTAPQNPYTLYHQQLVAAGLSPQDADKAVKVKAGLEAPQKMFAPHSGQWETVYGTKNGEPYAYRFSKALGQAVDLDGQPIDGGDLEGFVPAQKASSLKETIVPDPQSPTGFSKIAYDPSTGMEKSRQMNVVPPRGFIPTMSVTTDQFNNRMVTMRTPQLPGTGNVPSAASQPPAAQPPAQSSPQGAPPAQPKPFEPKLLTRPKPQVQAPTQRPAQPQAQSPTLDEQGHIPMRPGMNPQVLEFANRLMEGADTKDIPSKAQAPAEALARQYGWQGQGALNPKDKILINEAGAKLQQLFNSNSLAVLDRGVATRMKIAQALKSADKQGIVGTAATAMATANLDQQEQEFIRLYNAAVGTIAGLGPITRGNKQTEANIHRLMAEMPNVLQSASSSDAKARIQQLLQEIKVAEQTTGATRLGETTGNTPPPPAQGQHKVGDSVTLRDGRNVTIKEIHPDGTFTY